MIIAEAPLPLVNDASWIAKGDPQEGDDEEEWEDRIDIHGAFGICHRNSSIMGDHSILQRFPFARRFL